MSDNRHASAHRSGTRPCLTVSARAASAAARGGEVTGAAQRRGENHIALDTVAAQFRQSLLGELDTAFASRTASAPRPDAIASSERTQANRMSRRGCPPAAPGRRRVPAGRPTPRTGPRPGRRPPVRSRRRHRPPRPRRRPPRRGRPSHGRASASRAAAETTHGHFVPMRTSVPSTSRGSGWRGQPGGGVATLASGRHRAQPVLVGVARGNGHWPGWPPKAAAATREDICA